MVFFFRMCLSSVQEKVCYFFLLFFFVLTSFRGSEFFFPVGQLDFSWPGEERHERRTPGGAGRGMWWEGGVSEPLWLLWSSQPALYDICSSPNKVSTACGEFIYWQMPRGHRHGIYQMQVANSATLASRLKSHCCIRKTILYTKHLLIVLSLSTVNWCEMLRLPPKLQIQNVVWVEETTEQKSSFEQGPNPV